MMARLRFLAVALLALALAGNSTQLGRSAGDPPGLSKKPVSNTYTVTATRPASGDGPCTIYALSDLGYDSDLGQWIAQTIPEMVEPSSWQQLGGTGVLRYYAPKNILVVRNSATIQAKVDGFLKDLKKSLPSGSGRSSAVGKKTPRASIVPAAYQAPTPLSVSGPVPETSSYPVPAPTKTPKHLFHFLIRYEGEGIIDDNVVKYFKVTNQPEKTGKSEKEASDPTTRPTYAGGRAESSSLPSIPGTVIKANETKKNEDKKDDEKGNNDKAPY